MFGQVIKKVRKEKGMTQEDVARALNVKTSEISQYESGKRLPRLNTFLMLLDLFNLTADEALGREVEAVCDNSNYGRCRISAKDIDILLAIKSNRRIYEKFYINPLRFVQIIDVNFDKLFPKK